MLKISTCQGNAKSNDKSPHTCYQKRQEITSVGEDVEKREKIFAHCWWECKVQPPWKTVWRFLKKLKIKTTCYPAITLLGMYWKEMKTLT